MGGCQYYDPYDRTFYILKHKNTKLVRFHISCYSGTPTDVQFNDSKRKYLPIGVYDEGSLFDWITHRAIPVTREGIQSELHACGTVSTIYLMLLNCGISLTDVYWVHPVVLKDLTWEKVSPYRNTFVNNGFLSLRDLSSAKQLNGTSFSPSAALVGNLKKEMGNRRR